VAQNECYTKKQNFAWCPKVKIRITGGTKRRHLFRTHSVRIFKEKLGEKVSTPGNSELIVFECKIGLIWRKNSNKYSS
jgi:hypothetical protein